MHHPEGNHGYARASPAGPQAAQADLRRRGGRGAHARPGRFRRAAAAHHQRLRLRRHLEPPRARQQDPQPGGARHDRRAQSPGGVRRARARPPSQRLQPRGNPRGPAADRDVLRNPGRERRAPAGAGGDGTTQGAGPRVKIAVRPLVETDLDEADRVFRLAFGTEFGLPEPISFRGDSDLVKTRWRADPAAALGAFRGEELLGSSFAARWGSFGVFGPITVRPDCWESGIGKRLLEPTMALFEAWRIRQAGLFTFPQSPKHVALYQKFGFWPQALTAVMSKPVEPRQERGRLQPAGLLRHRRLALSIAAATCLLEDRAVRPIASPATFRQLPEREKHRLKDRDPCPDLLQVPLREPLDLSGRPVPVLPE